MLKSSYGHLTDLLRKIDKILTEQQIIRKILSSFPDQFISKAELISFKEEIMSHFGSLPTKEEFYTAMDKWMKAASTADIEKPLHKHEHEKIRKFLSFNQG